RHRAPHRPVEHLDRALWRRQPVASRDDATRAAPPPDAVAVRSRHALAERQASSNLPEKIWNHVPAIRTLGRNTVAFEAGAKARRDFRVPASPSRWAGPACAG